MLVKKGKPDLLLFSIVVLLVSTGLIMVLSASSVIGVHRSADPFHHFRRQAIWAGLGFVALFVLMKVDYRILKKLALPGVIVSFALLVAVLWVGEDTGGARRWISLGWFNLQPSEIAKFAMINFGALYIANKGRKIRRLFSGLVPFAIILAGKFALIVMEPDFGTAAALVVVAFMLVFVGGAYLGHLVLAVTGAAAGFFTLIQGREYRLRRVMAFLDPWSDPTDSGWNVIQSILAVGSGGLFGLGLGNSRQKFSYLPEHHTDFIFAVLAEELGFIGAGLIVVLFALFVWRGFVIAVRAQDMYGSLLAVGLTTMLGFQAFLNMGVATGILPITGIPLPFISYGGSSLLTALGAVGVLLNISRQAQPRRPKVREG